MSQYSDALRNVALNEQLLNQLRAQGGLQNAQSQFAAAMQAQACAQQQIINRPIEVYQIAKPAPPPALPISTQFGEIVAYRFWTYHRGFLRSAWHRYMWMPGKVAGLIEGQALEDYGPAGIYAFKSQSDMVLEAYDGDVVFGTVKLWGDVIEYERGYHAEFASIVSLDHGDLPSLRKYQDRLMTELRALYTPNLKAI